MRKAQNSNGWPPHPSPQSLPQTTASAYPVAVPDNALRRFRLDDETWTAYGDLVGDGGRSRDIREYIEWRLDNPDTPLPGRRRVRPRKQRTPRTNL